MNLLGPSYHRMPNAPGRRFVERRSPIVQAALTPAQLPPDLTRNHSCSENKGWTTRLDPMVSFARDQ
jgi:hypothetical protein